METNQTKQKKKERERERERKRASPSQICSRNWKKKELERVRTESVTIHRYKSKTTKLQHYEIHAILKIKMKKWPSKKRRIENAWKRVCESSELTVLLWAPVDLQAWPGKAPSQREKERELTESSERVCLKGRERERVDISGASDWAGRRYSLNFQIPKGNFFYYFHYCFCCFHEYLYHSHFSFLFLFPFMDMNFRM